jgi:hypothetical protein
MLLGLEANSTVKPSLGKRHFICWSEAGGFEPSIILRDDARFKADGLNRLPTPPAIFFCRI